MGLSEGLALGYEAGLLWCRRWKEDSKGLDICLDVGVKETEGSLGFGA